MKSTGFGLVTVVIMLAAVANGVAVKDVAVQQRYPWNGLMDISFTIEGVGEKPVAVGFSARKDVFDQTLPMETVRAADNSSPMPMAFGNGRHRVVWDAAADLPEGTVEYAYVGVSAEGAEKQEAYCEIDLDVVNGIRYMDLVPSLYYSTRWNDSPNVSIALDGKTITNFQATAEGVIWTPGLERGRTYEFALTDAAGTQTMRGIVAHVVRHSGEFLFDDTWSSNNVYVVDGDLTITSNVKIQPGTVVKFEDGVTLTIAAGARVEALGVIFTTFSDDTAGGDINRDGGSTKPRFGDYRITEVGELVKDEKTDIRYYSEMEEVVLEKDEFWTKDKEHLVNSNLVVPDGVTLEIEKGAVVRFGKRASLTVEEGGLCVAPGVRFDSETGADDEFDSYVISGIVEGDFETWAHNASFVLEVHVAGEFAWGKADNPVVRSYVIFGDESETSSLAIEPGTVVKFVSDGGLDVIGNAVVEAKGVEFRPLDAGEDAYPYGVRVHGEGRIVGDWDTAFFDVLDMPKVTVTNVSLQAMSAVLRADFKIEGDVSFPTNAVIRFVEGSGLDMRDGRCFAPGVRFESAEANQSVDLNTGYAGSGSDVGLFGTLATRVVKPMNAVTVKLMGDETHGSEEDVVIDGSFDTHRHALRFAEGAVVQLADGASLKGEVHASGVTFVPLEEGGTYEWTAYVYGDPWTRFIGLKSLPKVYLEDDLVVSAGREVVICSSLVVPIGRSLSFASGTTVKFTQGASLEVYGKCMAAGVTFEPLDEGGTYAVDSLSSSNSDSGIFGDLSTCFRGIDSKPVVQLSDAGLSPEAMDIVIRENLLVQLGKTLTFARGASVKVADGVTIKLWGDCKAEGVVFSPLEDGASYVISLGDLYTAPVVYGDFDTEFRGGILGGPQQTPFRVQLSRDLEVPADTVTVVRHPFAVPAGRTLVFAPGSVVKFKSGTSMDALGQCQAGGVIFTHICDDTVGGDTDGDGGARAPVAGDYTISGNVIANADTEFRYGVVQSIASEYSGELTFPGHCVYVVSNTIVLKSGADVTIGSGAVFKFAAGCGLAVNAGAKLTAHGTMAAPIVFTSICDDEWGGDTNGDGDATRAQPGDWQKLSVSGTVNMDHCQLLYGSSGNDKDDVILVNGGTVSFDNGLLAHGQMYAVGVESGHFHATNSVIRDFYCAFRHWPSDEFVNCVFYDCTRLSNNDGQKFRNCIIARVSEAWDGKSGNGNSYANCVIWNPGDCGLQNPPGHFTGVSGNIWADPRFLDPENGDFRIAADSPCVDAADGAAAPEKDAWGQTRQTIAEEPTGTACANGRYADIGICEVMPRMAESTVDLAVESVRGPDEVVPGEEAFVSWIVRNVGVDAAAGDWTDRIVLVSPDGTETEVATRRAEAELGVGVPKAFSAKVTVPALPLGKARFRVYVNADHAIFEGTRYENNVGTSAVESDVTVTKLTAKMLADAELSLPAGENVVYDVGDLSSAGGYLVLETGARKLTCYVAVGRVPDPEHDRPIAAEPVSGGAVVSYRLTAKLPSASSDRRVYVLLLNEQSQDARGFGGRFLANDPDAPFVIDTCEAFCVPELTPVQLSVPMTVDHRYVSGGQVYSAQEAMRKIDKRRREGVDTPLTDASDVCIRFTGRNLPTDSRSRAAAVATLTCGSVVYRATNTSLESDTAGVADFDLSEAPEGEYVFALEVDEERAEAAEPLALESGLDAFLTVWVEMSDSVRAGHSGVMYVHARNDGFGTAPAPVVFVSGNGLDKMRLSSSDPWQTDPVIVLMAGNSSPVSFLMPGAERTVPVYYQIAETGTTEFKAATPMDDQDVKWADVFGTTDAASRYAKDIGETWRDWTRFVGDEAEYLHGIGRTVTSFSRLVEFGFRRLSGFGVSDVLLAEPDVAVSAGATSLAFVRTAYRGQTTDGENVFGVAWRHNYQTGLDLGAQDLAVYYAQGQALAVFKKENGTWLAKSDGGFVLSETEGGYELRDASASSRVRFDARGRCVEQKSGASRLAFAYDGDLLTRVTAAGGESLTFGYDAKGRIVSVTDPGGHKVVYTYNADNALQKVELPVGLTTEYTYDASGAGGRLRTYSRNNGRSGAFDYDSLGRLVRLANQDTFSTVDYPRVGGEVTMRDAKGNVKTTVRFDEFGREVTRADAEGMSTARGYDAEWRLKNVKDPDGGTSEVSYDAEGRVVSARNAAGRQTRIAYDRGKLSGIVDALGRETSFSTDEGGRLTGIAYVDGAHESFGYDAAGNLTDVTNCRGRRVRQTFDKSGRLLLRETDEDGWQAFAYDAAGNVTNATDSVTGPVDIRYDERGRAIRVCYGKTGKTFEYAYDEAGRCVCRRDGDGDELRYAYDAKGHLASMSTWSGGVRTSGVDYIWDVEGNLAQQRRDNGTYTDYVRDVRGNVTEIRHYDADGKESAYYLYAYDRCGRKTSKTTSEGVETYAYDINGRLANITYPDGNTERRTYDDVGNCKSIQKSSGTFTYDVDALNRYTRAGDLVFGYDADGNLTNVVHRLTAKTVEYRYDSLNRVRGRRENGVWLDYHYDANGNLCEIVSNGVVVINYTYDWVLGNTLAEQQDMVTGGTTKFNYDDRTNLQNVQETPSVGGGGEPQSEVQYQHHDANGNTTRQSGSDGKTGNETHYSPDNKPVDAPGGNRLPNNPGRDGYPGDPADVVAQVTGLRDAFPDDNGPSGLNPSLPTRGTLGGRNLNTVAQGGSNNSIIKIDPTPTELLTGGICGLATSALKAGGGVILIALGAGSEGLTGCVSSAVSIPVVVLGASQFFSGVYGMGNAVRDIYTAMFAMEQGISNVPGYESEPYVSAFIAKCLFGETAGNVVTGLSMASDFVSSFLTGKMLPYMKGLPVTSNKVFNAIAKFPEFIDKLSKWTKVNISRVLNVTQGVLCVAEQYRKGLWDKLVNWWERITGKVTSVDPNEMAGPAGIGEQRRVKPGENLTYTIYFENKADATAAACEVTVTTDLDPSLDWSTFETGDIFYNNESDDGLMGRCSGSSERRMSGLPYSVISRVDLDGETGRVVWKLQVHDETTVDGWPADLTAGFLPPNDPETHCGEGHITYRVRVRDDAAANARIESSATIVFDYNDPITTDPSWWNTVGEEKHEPDGDDEGGGGDEGGGETGGDEGGGGETPEPAAEPEPKVVPIVFESFVAGAVSEKGATYNGFLGGEDSFGGTFTLVVKKPKKGETAAAATLTRVNPVTGKKEKVSGTVDVMTGLGAGGLAGLELNATGVGGKLGDFTAQGAVDAAKAKDTETLDLMNGFDKSVYSVVLTNANGSCALLTATFSKKGKVKVVGTVDGVKFSCSAQMSVGDRYTVVPFAYAKPAKGVAVSAVLWFDKETKKLVDVTGVEAGVVPMAFGDASAPAAGEYRFLMAEADVLASVQNAISNTAYEVKASFDGKKYDAGKPAKVKYDKKTSTLTVDTSKGTDVSGLKLKYAKGAISGSFTVYEVDVVKDKLVKNKFTVNGVIVNGVGHGLATNKKLKPIPVEVTK